MAVIDELITVIKYRVDKESVRRVKRENDRLKDELSGGRGPGRSRSRRAGGGARSARQSQQTFRAAAGAAQQVGALMLGASAAIGNAAARSVTAFMDWEQAFAGVRKTVEGSPEEMAALEQELNNLSKILPIDRIEILGVAEAAGQLGIATGDVSEFTRVMTMMGVATNLTAERAATELARFANITGLQSHEYEQLGATIVQLGNNLATTERDIVNMSQRMAGAGTIAGLSQADILGLAGALSSVGIRAESGGSSFSRIITDIGNAVDRGGEKMMVLAETAGMTEEGFANLYESNPAEAFMSVVHGLANIQESGGNMNTVLEDMGWNSIRVADLLRRAAQNTELFDNAVHMANQEFNKSADEISALQREMEIFTETLRSKLTLLQNAFGRLGTAVGKSLEPVVTKIIDFLVPIIDKITKWVEENPKLASTLLIVTGAILGVVGAVMLLVPLISMAAVVFSPLILKVLAIGAAVGALIVGVVALVKNWDKINAAIERSPFLSTLFKILRVVSGFEALVAVINLVKHAIENIGPILEWFQSAWDTVAATFGVLKEIATDVWSDIEGWISHIIGKLRGPFTDAVEFVNGIIEWLADAWDTVAGAAGMAAEFVSNIFNGIFGWIGSKLNEFIDSAKAWSNRTFGTNFKMSWEKEDEPERESGPETSNAWTDFADAVNQRKRAREDARKERERQRKEGDAEFARFQARQRAAESNTGMPDMPEGPGAPPTTPDVTSAGFSLPTDGIGGTGGAARYAPPVPQDLSILNVENAEVGNLTARILRIQAYMTDVPATSNMSLPEAAALGVTPTSGAASYNNTMNVGNITITVNAADGMSTEEVGKAAGDAVIAELDRVASSMVDSFNEATE